MGVARGWLPPELSVAQPYSMGPLVRWDARIMAPAHGSCARINDDRTTCGRGVSGQIFSIMGMFIAPRSQQEDPRRSITRFYAPGLLEALGVVKQRSDAIAEQVATVIETERAVSFIEALYDFEEGDDD